MTPANNSDPVPNRILAALPDKEYQRLLPHLKQIELHQGEILYAPGGLIEYVYFPGSGIISLVTILKDGASVEVGVVGREGMCGISLVLGDNRAPTQAVVQIGNGGVRLKADILGEELKRGGELRNLLQRFILVCLQRASQAAACNRNHHVGERLAFWLLTCQDSIGHNNLKLTQDFIAEMLGTRRAGVSEAAMTLQGLGLIQYSRGNIHIVDRAGLEEFSCECYRAVRQEFERLLSGPKSRGEYLKRISILLPKIISSLVRWLGKRLSTQDTLQASSATLLSAIIFTFLSSVFSMPKNLAISVI